MGCYVLRSALLATSLLLATIVSEAAEFNMPRSNRNADTTAEGHPVSRIEAGRLNGDNRIRDLLNHAAFGGHSRLLMPWSDRTYDDNMRLSDIGSLLPYHSHVDPKTVLAGLNRMIDDVNDGKPVFYDFYTDAQKRADPTKEQAGLFLFRGKPGAPFAVISPGGGFSYVGSVHEGFPYAVEISGKGYSAFVLKYRTGYGGTVATEDLAAAISYICRNAESLGVDKRDYALWGSSAGARMAAAIGTHGVAAFGGDDLPKPAAVVMAYTAHSDSASDDPPTFVVVGERDGISPPAVMERRVSTLRRAGTEVEFHKYKDLGHGFGPGTGTSAEGWIADAMRFWQRFIKNAAHSNEDRS
jgi:acetyl esterase/lipase